MSLARGLQEASPFLRLLEDVVTTSARSGIPSAISSMGAFQPRFDVRELNASYELVGELPGVSRQDVSVEWEDDRTLTVSGHVERRYAAPSSEQVKHDASSDPPTSKPPTNRSPAPSEESKYWVTERMAGEFRRSWTFSTAVDQAHIKASLKDGILSIIVPKLHHHVQQSENVMVE